jgi:trk system potassium uptake protein TrkH
MVLFGINFNLYFLLLCRRFRDVFRSEELRVYFIILGVAVAVVSLDIYAYGVYDSFWDSLHHGFFQVSSVMTTTGFATTDFNLWPEVSRVIMLLVMCVGSCAGSTAGGLKVSRIIVAVKGVFVELRRVLNPRRVSVVKYDGKKINDGVIRTTFAYLIIYIIAIVASLIVISFDRFDFTTNFSAVIATINNIGPGFGEVGPLGNFASYGILSKLMFIFNMLLGRLEIYPPLIVAYSIFRAKRVRKNQQM